ncbi:MAG: peptide chain release factor 2 [Desulfobacterales bacterium C00003104]|nr:MAG: peptide chain release factor 2 [Desulfobacterales bacterium C00003104]
MSADGFWNDPEKGKPLLKERTSIQNTVQNWETIKRDLEDAEILFELAMEEDDRETIGEVGTAINALSEAVRRLSLRRMLGGEKDDSNAIVSINAGAGGTEAQDWVAMLLRMYLRWCERKGYEIKTVDHQPGDEAGIKSVTFTATGRYAYGYLKAETGIHRLVRISPFDASNRRHTSFASVFVMPEVDDTIDITIDEKDLRVDTFRSSGAGGQHVNKTDSGIRITHMPTNIVVQCQQDRSQHRNKAMAMTVLKARLYELEQREKEKELQSLHDSKQEITWGSQIRSYTLQPYQMVKDHRIDLAIGNVTDVLDGNIDPFIEGVLLAGRQKA